MPRRTGNPYQPTVEADEAEDRFWRWLLADVKPGPEPLKRRLDR